MPPSSPLLHANPQLPLLGPCPLTGVLATPVAVAVAVVWAVERNQPWAWVLQDLQVGVPWWCGWGSAHGKSWWWARQS